MLPGLPHDGAQDESLDVQLHHFNGHKVLIGDVDDVLQEEEGATASLEWLLEQSHDSTQPFCRGNNCIFLYFSY